MDTQEKYDERMRKRVARSKKAKAYRNYPIKGKLTYQKLMAIKAKFEENEEKEKSFQ